MHTIHATARQAEHINISISCAYSFLPKSVHAPFFSLSRFFFLCFVRCCKNKKWLGLGQASSSADLRTERCSHICEFKPKVLSQLCNGISLHYNRTTPLPLSYMPQTDPGSSENGGDSREKQTVLFESLRKLMPKLVSIFQVKSRENGRSVWKLPKSTIVSSHAIFYLARGS